MSVLVSFLVLFLIPSQVGALGLSLLIWMRVLLRRFFDTAFWAKTFFPYLLWPLLMFSGLCYLGRMAFLSFWQHGRRPNVIFGGFFQIGDVFDWKLGIYGPGVTYHHLRPVLYDWWIQLQNPVLVDRWLEEQNKSLYFRWGSFFRYFWLGIYCTCGALARGFRRVISTFLGGEFGHSVLLFVFFLGKLLWPLLSPLIWFASQCWSRFTYALGGETVASAFFRFALLDRLVRYQWHQRFNVDTDYTPEAIYQKPLPLALLSTLWYGIRRLFSLFRGNSRPLFSQSGPVLSLLGLGLLGLILFPLGFFSGLFFLGLRLTFSVQTLYYGFLQKILDSSLDGSQKLALFLLWTSYSFLLFLSRVSFWGVHFLLAFGRSLLRLAPFFIAALFAAWLAFGTDYSFSIFSFGFGTIFLDFLEQFLRLFWIFPEAPSSLEKVILPRVSDTMYLLDLHEDWMDPQLYYPWGPAGFPMRVRWSIMKMDPKPVLTSATILDPQLNQNPRFLYWFENFLVEQAWEARVYQRYALMFASDWWGVMEDFENWIEVLYSQPFAGIYYEIMHRYYGFIYGALYLHYSFYWFFLAYFHKPYLWALILTPLPSVLLIWPLRFFLQLLRTLAQESALLSLLLSLLVEIFSGLSLVASKLISLGFSLLAAAKLEACSGASSLVSFLASLALVQLSWLREVPLVAFFWAYPLRWLTWMFSVIFGDVPSHFSFLFSLERKTQRLWELLALAQRWWPRPEMALWQGFSLWSLTLWLYFQLQFLWDRLCLCAEFPRHLDDYTQFFLHRKLRRPVFLTGVFTSASIKGAFFTGHRWVQSPVLLFHYALSEPWLSLRSSYILSEPAAPHFSLGPLQGEVALSQLWALAPVIVDAERLFMFIAPLLYFLGLLLFCASFSGASSLLGDRAVDQQPFYRSRQGAWDQFRRKAIQGSLQEIDKYLIFPPLDILRAAGVPMTPLVNSKAQKLFARIQEQSLAYRQLPPRTVLSPLAQKESLARGQRSFYRGLRRRSEVPLIFWEFLSSPKYKNFRGNFLDVDLGTHFLAFIAYFYSRNPEIPFCWRNYHDDDYLPWPSDLRTEIVQQLVASGDSLSSLLEETNERLFQRQLGEWLWSQDPGNLAFFQTQSESFLGPLAYESEDQDTDAVFPWALCGWFFYVPLYLFSNLFMHFEHSWVDDPIIIGAGTGEVYRDTLLEHNLFGHFYLFYRQIEITGWDLLPEFETINNPVSDMRQAPIHGFRGDWKEGYYQAFYPSTIHWCFYSAQWAFYWGTWRPQVFFQDEARGAVRLLLLLLALRWAYGRRSSVVAPALSSLPVLLWKGRWSHIRPLFYMVKAIYFRLFK